MERSEEQKTTSKIVMDQVKQAKDSVQCYLDKHPLLVLKLFYFFALSSLSLKVVYMPLYFKQVGLPAIYTGVLAGLPPFIRGGGALFLGIVADKLKKRRVLFLVSLLANMVIPLLCLIPRVEYPVCDADFAAQPVTDPLGMPLESVNPDGSLKSALPQSLYQRINISSPASSVPIAYYSQNVTLNGWPEARSSAFLHNRVRRSAVRDLVNGKSKSSQKLGIFEFYRRTSGRRSEIPSNNKAVINSSKDIKMDVKKSQVIHPHKKSPQESQDMLVTIFLTLLILLIIGEFLGGPLRSLADLSVLEAMEGDKTNYGEVALWMQVGKIFLAPMILALIRAYPLHVCDSLKDNYEYSLYPLSAFSAFSLVFGCSIKFNEEEDETAKEKLISKEDSQKTLLDVIFTFKTFTILVLSFFAGGLSAVHYTFIFWYLTDLSPKDSAMVIAVVIVLRDIVSSISYKMSGRTLGLLGPVNTLHLALLLYIISFLSYAVMENPWFAIVPEVIQYIVFPLAYSSFVVYLGMNTPDHLNATVQGIYQCLYYGVGFGCGPIMAGILFEHVGGANTFLIFSAVSFALLLFSLARHSITRHFDRLEGESYEKVPSDDNSEDEEIRKESDY